MNGANSSDNWTAVLHRRAHLLYQQIAAMQRLHHDSGATDKIEAVCLPYYKLLDELYEHDMPIAQALDNSDLLLHLEGEGLTTRSPRLSLVTGIMGDVRKQVGSMIKTLVSSFHEKVELPREFELGLSSFARGSLYLGFCLPQGDSTHAILAGDPLFAASQEALTTLGKITSTLDEPDAQDVIRRDFPDPKLRDAALTAVGQLAPSGRRGVSSVGIGGRAMENRPWRILTPQTRLQVRAWLEQPVLSDEVVELSGRVRAVDLDSRRFDLRRIDGDHPDLRCIYTVALDGPAKGWLDCVVAVRGRVEMFQGAARLLQVECVTEI